MKLTILLSMVATFGTGCGPGPAPRAARLMLPGFAESGKSTPEGSLDRQWQSPLLADAPRACERLGELRALPTGADSFSFLAGAGLSAGKSTEPWIAVDVATSPLTQVALSELTLGPIDRFLEAAEGAWAKGEIGAVKWAALVAARTIWKDTGWAWPIRKIQIGATNDKIAATFPGIFGEPASASKSFAGLLIRKLDPTAFGVPTSVEMQAFLTRVPLIDGDDWVGLSHDVERSLAAVAQTPPLQSGIAPSERACSFVLLQRGFAQLLSLKGYTGVASRRHGDRPWQEISKLSTESPSFEKALSPGAFADDAGRVILSANDIASYDPRLHAVRLASSPRVKIAEKPDGATIDQEIAFMRSLSIFFELTSPAAPWAPTSDSYMFGNVSERSNRALLPDDAHALAIGLFLVELKNLAATRMVKIVDTGRAVRAGEAPSGAALVSGQIGDQTGDQTGGQIGGQIGGQSVRLNDALDLLDVVIYMDEALKSFRARAVPVDAWGKQVAFYSRETMAKIFGPLLFSSIELKVLLPNAAKNLSLKDSLDALKFPLVAASLRFIDAGVSALVWSPETGFGKPTAGLDNQLRQHARAVLMRVAVNANSRALVDRASRL